MYVFQMITWILFGLSLTLLHPISAARRPIAASLAGMFGALCGGVLARTFALPPFLMFGYSLTAFATAALLAEVCILLVGKGSKPVVP